MDQTLGSWYQLAEPWQLAFRQAWDAYQADCCPAGAVLLDTRGAVIALGQNRAKSTKLSPSPSFQEPAQMYDSVLAHAPLNCLMQIPFSNDFTIGPLFTVVEPCLTCLAAASALGVGTIEFAFAEPYSGATNTIPIDLRSKNSWPEVKPPKGGPVSEIFYDLYVNYYLDTNSADPMLRHLNKVTPKRIVKATTTAALFEHHRISGSSLVSALESATDGDGQ